MSELVINLEETPDEGKRLAEIIARDGRTLRQLGKLMEVRFEELSYTRLSQTKRLGSKLATAATLLWELPPGFFQNAKLPEGLEAVPAKALKGDPITQIKQRMESAEQKLDLTDKKLDTIISMLEQMIKQDTK